MAQNTYEWTLEPFQQQGNLWLRRSTNAPFRAQQGQISVYNGTSFPSNPEADRRAWQWDDVNQPDPWNTGLPWGTNWYCAWIAEKSPNGPYTYVVQVITADEADLDADE